MAIAILFDADTGVLVQGVTGREASAFAKDMIDYGTRVVAGVVPGRGGEVVHGVTVHDTVREALGHGDVTASVVAVPPLSVKSAALEAVEGGIPLMVILTERVPRRDVVEIVERARTAGTRVVGPNSLGIISPGRWKIGAIGGPPQDARRSYSPGPVAIMSRSGGMTTEIANLLTMNGVGQSICISIGGDYVVGSTFADLTPVLEEDPNTRCIVVFGEPGGTKEEQLADYVREKGSSKPIIAFIAGKFVDSMPGTRFGHAGVIVEGDRGSVRGKVQALRQAGVTVVDEFSMMPMAVKRALSK